VCAVCKSNTAVLLRLHSLIWICCELRLTIDDAEEFWAAYATVGVPF
jgi:hypothetical protein